MYSKYQSYSTTQKKVTTLLWDANHVARYAIPIAQDAIFLARDGLKTVSTLILCHGCNSSVISRIDGKALLWLTCEHNFTSATCRLLHIKICFLVQWFSCYALPLFRDVVLLNYICTCSKGHVNRARNVYKRKICLKGPSVLNRTVMFVTSHLHNN